ncbi:MAG: serine/threonine-protein kinase PknG [Actinomycetota bacterium]|nr:serine/threonine-protein kinase PknG [Actinomycetota bacterium]
MSGCVRTNCPGTYESDDTCDTCGFKRPKAASTHSVSTGRSTSTNRRVVTGGGRARQGIIGAGLLELPKVPARDPVTAVLVDPQVPENRRVCHKCGELVGQRRGDRPGLPKGYCPHDGTPFSFVPPLHAGDVIDRYEVLGCLAYGGLGWIYLARDGNLSDGVAEHWVVLKGLIDDGDVDAIAAAVHERQFLVEVNHPNIVKIMDFVRHPDPRSGTLVGYIVMEYLGGLTLRELFLRHHDPGGQRAPLPLASVLAYGLDVLDALAYLHRRGLAFCDLKPENVLHVDEQVKLIDLGAVLPIGSAAMYYTEGYDAPELTETPPRPVSAASDLFSLGRMLAMLCDPFPGFSTYARHHLPDPVPGSLFAEFESVHRLLSRATDLDPAARFTSAEEMREQVHGTLVEVLALSDGTARPAVSTSFGPERRVFGAEPADAVDWSEMPSALPTPLVDLSDPAAGFLATLGVTEPEDLVSTLDTAPKRTPEVLLRLVDARITMGNLDYAEQDLDEFAESVTRDWRVVWYRSVMTLAGPNPGQAVDGFDEVYRLLPGEIAPRLALAAATEAAGDFERAGVLYHRVWTTNVGYVSAAFGLARVRSHQGDVDGAVAALDGVPESSSHHLAARAAAIRARVAGTPTTAYLLDAGARLQRLAKIRADAERDARLRIEVLASARRILSSARGTDSLFGEPLDEFHVGLGLEKAYRTLAGLTADRAARSALIDLANHSRPWTLV